MDRDSVAFENRRQTLKIIKTNLDKNLEEVKRVIDSLNINSAEMSSSSLLELNQPVYSNDSELDNIEDQELFEK